MSKHELVTHKGSIITMWNQTKCINIKDVKRLSHLFEIGCNWNNRKQNLLLTDNPKAEKLINELDKRIDKIVKVARTCDVNASPIWYHDKIMQPFYNELKKLRNDDRKRN